jgi:hypothetical protein
MGLQGLDDANREATAEAAESGADAEIPGDEATGDET